MNTFCPISDKRVDENSVRINSSIAFIITIVALFDFAIIAVILSFFLMLDFIVRGYIDSKYSIVHFIGRAIAKLLSLPEKKINAGPKIFAAQVGSIMSLGIFLGVLLEIPAIGYIFGITLAFCAFLEFALGFCVACKLYPLFRKVQLPGYESSRL